VLWFWKKKHAKCTGASVPFIQNIPKTDDNAKFLSLE
jgi:hypothetical protein